MHTVQLQRRGLVGYSKWSQFAGINVSWYQAKRFGTGDHDTRWCLVGNGSSPCCDVSHDSHGSGLFRPRLANDHTAAMQADAEGCRDAQMLLEAEGCQQGPQGVVLLR
jgi:hypothetical protein